MRKSMSGRSWSAFAAQVACTLFVWLLASAAAAQSTATLQGLVTDEQGAIVPGVSIVARSKATGVERTAVSDAAGQYLLASLAPGLYQVEAQLSGFKPQAKEVELAVARTVSVDFQLGVGTVAEAVTVVAETPVIESSTISVGQVINQRTVQDIPLNGRHFVDLGLLIPGSVTPPQAGFLTAPLRGQGSFAFNSAGNREDTVNFMVNGVNLNDMVQNQITFQPSINTVSQFKVDNSTFSAEYGRNSGAIVNIATRSGTNEVHGEAFEFFRNEELDARNFFNRRAGAAVAVQAQPVRRQRGRPHREEPDVLLRQLRGAAAAAGHRRQQRRAPRGRARGGHRSGLAQSAAVHPVADRHRVPGRRPLRGVGHGAGRHRPGHGRHHPRLRRERHAPRLLRVPGRRARRADPAGQHDPGIRRHARIDAADWNPQPHARVRDAAGERGPVRLQSHPHHLHAQHAAEPRRVTASTTASPRRSACRR